MNILIPHSWLLEHLDTTATPLEIQKYLSLCGPSIERIYEREGDSVYDIEVTTNRVDSMSVRGIAREAAVILTQFGIEAKLRPVSTDITPLLKKASTYLPVPKIVNDQGLCQRIICIALGNVQRNETPEWMAKRLRQIEISVHDAVIDITNYVTHELGHPCHAFDYDKLVEYGGTIIITEAKAGKKFTTLDGVEYTTAGGEIVFENEAGEIIDLPGIKGTANSSINSETKNVLLLAESCRAEKIRFASMTHAIRTVAAQINEKHVDPHLAQPVIELGARLFHQLASAKFASQIHDEFPGKKEMPSVRVPLARIHEYLGIELPLNTIGDILEQLECEVKLEKGTLKVTPPTFRPDIQIPADVIEEIARIYGYHNLPSVIMPTAIPLKKPGGTNFTVENQVKRFLAAIGWQELYTYSMVSVGIAEATGYALDQHLRIQNPLSDDRVYLRRSLIPSLEEIIAQNSQKPILNIFEVANVYHPKKTGLPEETLELTLLSTENYRKVKGYLEALLERFFVAGFSVEISPDKYLLKLYQQSARLTAQASSAAQEKGSTVISFGRIGVLENGHVAVTLEMTKFLQVIRSHPTYQPLPKTSEIIEDLTFTLPEKTQLGQVISDLKSLSPLLKKIGLSDVFGQNMTLRFTYTDPTKNITVDEVSPLRKKVVQTVAEKWSGNLVGKLE